MFSYLSNDSKQNILLLSTESISATLNKKFHSSFKTFSTAHRVHFKLSLSDLTDWKFEKLHSKHYSNQGPPYTLVNITRVWVLSGRDNEDTANSRLFRRAMFASRSTRREQTQMISGFVCAARTFLIFTANTLILAKMYTNEGPERACPD